MQRTGAGVALGALAALLMAGCGGSGSPPGVSLHSVPLVPGARVIEQTRQCDRGANAFCAVEAILVDRRLSSSGALVTRERKLLRQAGWSRASGDFGQEHGADSSGHRLHVTYGTALADLTGIVEGWIKRPHTFAVALSDQIFARAPAMALMVETGPS